MFSKRVVCFAFLIAVALACTTSEPGTGSPIEPGVVKIFADGGHPPPPPPTPPAPTAIAESPMVFVADGGHPPPPPWS